LIFNLKLSTSAYSGLFIMNLKYWSLDQNWSGEIIGWTRLRRLT